MVGTSTWSLVGLDKHPKFHGATPTTGGWSTTSTRILPGQGLVTYPRGLLVVEEVPTAIRHQVGCFYHSSLP